MRPDHSQAFSNIISQQVAVLEAAFLRPALNMQINPARPLMPLRRAKPFFLLIREASPMKAGLSERKTSETKSKDAHIHWLILGAASLVSSERAVRDKPPSSINS